MRSWQFNQIELCWSESGQVTLKQLQPRLTWWQRLFYQPQPVKLTAREAQAMTQVLTMITKQPSDDRFLGWIADRLVHVYCESPNTDFVVKLRRLAGEI